MKISNIKRFMVLALCGLALAAPAVAHAQEDEAKTARAKIQEAAQALTKGFDKTAQRHFNVMYGNQNLIDVVGAVRDDLGAAVKACGEENPDLKEPMAARYKDWKDAVAPILKEAGGNVDNMIIAQDYAKAKDIRKFFKLVAKERKAQSELVEKIPVTSAQACNTMLKKMDQTQPNMVKLLRQTLVSLPQAIEAEDRETKKLTEEKAKAEAEALNKKAEEDAVKAAEKAKKKAAKAAKEAADDATQDDTP